VVAGLLAVGLLADLLAPYSYDDFNPARRLRPPTAAHPFGTDEQGRDVLSRVVYGARVSMVVAVGSALVATLVGSVIGTLSGYFGGTADLMTQRLIDVWLAFPGLIFVIFLVGILSNSFPVLILTIGLLYSAGSSRVVRGAVMVIRDSLYVEAARALGARHGRILLRHILPNVLSVIIVNASAQLGRYHFAGVVPFFPRVRAPAPLPQLGSDALRSPNPDGLPPESNALSGTGRYPGRLFVQHVWRCRPGPARPPSEGPLKLKPWG